MVNVDKIIIFTQSGSPIVLFDFSNQQMVVDESLLSGFLSAIDGFSTQLFRSSSKQFSIDTGKSIISLFKTDKIILTCIADANLTNLGDKIQKILSEFENKHHVDGVLVRDAEEFWDTRHALIRAIYRIPISEDWIVIIKKDQPKYSEYLTHYPVIFSQTEKSDVRSLLDKTKFQKETLYTILNAGYYDGVLNFENMLEERDYIHASASISKLLNASSDDYKYFKAKYPSINLTMLIQDLDCAIRIKDLEKKHGNQALNLVKEMFDKKYIELIEEDNRRIYIVMDLISEIIQIINELGNKKKTFEFMKNALIELNDPAITHKFDLSGEDAKITKDSCYAESLSESEITQITNKWLSLLKIIIEANYAKYKTKLIDRIYEHFTQGYLNLSHTSDLQLLDPILLLLEKYMK